MSGGPNCKACGEPVSLERGITAVGDLNAPGMDYYCEPCAPNSGRGYTLADLQQWREGDELGPGLHEVGPEPYDYVFNPAEGQRITAVNVDGRTYTGTVTGVEKDKETGEIKLTAAAIPDGPPFIPGVDVHLGERTVYRSFTCARCGAVCSTATTEAEANREYLASGQPSGSGISSVCDDCYAYVMERARADGLIG